MASKTYPITGITVEPGQQIPTRQEITAWLQNDANKYQVSLFMQALTKFKEEPIENPFSYFQVAGIHCYPLVGWDGEKGVQKPPVSSDTNPGYCAHNRVTFPTWHRPYMLLYEQLLHETMIQMIHDWKLSDPEEEKIWRKAANQFRLPYWDWARKQEYTGNFGIPQVCTVEFVNIVMPGGLSKPLPNPLIKFSNPGNVAMGDKSMKEYAIKDHDPNKDKDPKDPTIYNILPWSKCVATSRYGILVDPHKGKGPDPDWVHGVNNWESCNQALADPQWYAKDGGSLADAVNRMLCPTYLKSWEPFASTKWNNPKYSTHYLSIEYIHNIVHNITGGQYMAETDKGGKHLPGFGGLGLGHMSDVPVAAFDPIFWLHHCNIDRLLAFWQTLHPEKWFDSPNQPQPKPPKDPLPPDPLPTDPLLPFHYDTQNHRWSSDRARDWKKLHYQYDDLVSKNGHVDGSDEHLNELRDYINEIYRSTSSIVRKVPNCTLPGTDDFHDYTINVVYDRYALRGLASSILFFIGEPPENLSTYRQSDNFLGAVYTFSNPVNNADGSVACENCAQQSSAKVLSKAQIPITLPLLSKAAIRLDGPPGEQVPLPPVPDLGLGGLEPETVEKVLSQELRVVFVALGGDRALDKSLFPNTDFAVMHGTGSHVTAAGMLSSFRGYKALEGATKDQYLGLGHDDETLHLIRDDPET